MELVDQNSIKEIITEYKCNYKLQEHPESFGSWIYEINKGNATLQIIFDGKDNEYRTRISHGNDNISGFVNIGVLDNINIDNTMFLDSIRYGMELLKIVRKT